jgi:hypothetical protein
VIKEISSILCADGKQARPAKTCATKLAGVSLIALLGVFMVSCGSTTLTSKPSLSGDWGLTFTVNPTLYTDTGTATLASDPCTGAITGTISTVPGGASDPGRAAWPPVLGTFDVSGTLDETTGGFTFSFTGTCDVNNAATPVTTTFSGSVSGGMNGTWTESAPCTATLSGGTFTGFRSSGNDNTGSCSNPSGDARRSSQDQ